MDEIVEWQDSILICPCTGYELIKCQNCFTGKSKGALLGRGTFSRVVKAILVGTPVAVKYVVHDNESESSNVNDWFDTEIASLKAIRHPNVVTIMGYTVQQKLIFELLDQGTLSEVLIGDRKRSLEETWPRYIEYAIHISRGLAHVHALDFVHCDVKCDNVMVGAGGVAKLVGFGSSFSTGCGSQFRGNKSQEKTPSDSSSQQVEGTDSSVDDGSSAVLSSVDDGSRVVLGESRSQGTSVVPRSKGIRNALLRQSYTAREYFEQQNSVAWAAPEVISGSRYTVHSDIYAFGILMWELVARHRPYPNFVNAPVKLLVSKILKEGYRPSILTETTPVLSRVVPSGYMDFMQTCWDEDPTRRPSSEFVELRMEELMIESEELKQQVLTSVLPVEDYPVEAAQEARQ